MSFIRNSSGGSAASAPVINGLDANVYINSLPKVISRQNMKRLPMGSTNLMQKSDDAGFAMLSVAGGSKPVTAKTPAPPPKSAALSSTHWTQRNASAGGTMPSTRAVNSLRSRSVDASQSRATAQAPAPVLSVGASLSLTASHMSPIKQSLKGYQSEMSRAKPETSKDLVEEMQKKAKARADSWKQKLLADANSAEAQREAARKQKEQERIEAEKAAVLYRARMYAINDLMRAQEWAVYLRHSKSQPASVADGDSDSDHSPKGYMSPMKRSPSRGGLLLSRDGSPSKGSPHTPLRPNGL